MDYNTFQIGFWHPFGPHSNEPPEKILARKAKEIEDNGWTLWSFQYRRMLEEWYRQLTIAAAGKVFVFCSCGSGRDPLARGGTAQAVDCQSYRFVGQGEWRPIPERIRVPHTLPSGKGLASAFLVQRLIHPVQRSVLPTVEWFSRKGQWRQGFQVGEQWCPGVPTRGEYLIRPGGNGQMRVFQAVLELRPPYLAVVSTDPA